jgi:hypothetical protein
LAAVSTGLQALAPAVGFVEARSSFPEPSCKRHRLSVWQVTAAAGTLSAALVQAGWVAAGFVEVVTSLVVPVVVTHSDVDGHDRPSRSCVDRYQAVHAAGPPVGFVEVRIVPAGFVALSTFETTAQNDAEAHDTGPSC